MEKVRIKVFSYNIHKGFSLGGGRYVLDQIRTAIQSVGADLVFMQEVLGRHDEHAKKIKEWPVASQFEYLADSVWSHYAYGKNAVYTPGHHGNAVLSKYPFTSWENMDVSFGSKMERRGVLHGVLEVKSPSGASRPLHVICVHLGLFEKDRVKQIEQIAKRIHDQIPADQPVILAGDFNDWREISSKKLFAEAQLKEVFWDRTGKHARTFPSWFPMLKLDRIYYRGCELKNAVVYQSNPWDSLSDHLPIGAEFEV